MSRRNRWFATLAVVALAAPATAVASASGTTVTVKKWLVSTASGHTKRVAPSSTVLLCRSQTLVQLLITARVSGAVEGQAYQERIVVNGVRRDFWHRKWKADDAHVPFGVANPHGLPVGQWSWTLTQSGNTLAQTSVTIRRTDC